MFSSDVKIKKRTSKNNVGRFEFLSQLVNEFKSTQSLEVKHQVMANLANFAYDPINYDHLRTLGVLNLFLEQLCEDETMLCRFALGGLCNLALDNENKDYINSRGGIGEISRCLKSSCIDTVRYAITTLMFLINFKYKAGSLTMFRLLIPVFLLQSTNICSGKEAVSDSPTAAFFPKTSLQIGTSVVDKNELVPCTCGIFLTGQFVKGSRQQPSEGPVLLHEQDRTYPCSPLGRRQCANKCLEVIAQHLPKSPGIICGSIGRDCFKERAYLWTKNCKDVWENSNMSAGREFCCKDSLPYKCALGKQ